MGAVIRQTLDSCFPIIEDKGEDTVTDDEGFTFRNEHWMTWRTEVRRHIIETDVLSRGGMLVASSSEINPPIPAEDFKAMVEAMGELENPDFSPLSDTKNNGRDNK